MYDVYIKNYTNPDGYFISYETLLYSIPFDENEPNILIDPIVKTEMGKTGSFEFSIYPNHPFFNAWHQMKTIMRVVYDGDTLFRGRVLTIDNSPMTGARKVHLEGDMAFLMDSQQEGIKDGDRPEQTLSSYLQQVIDNHNSQMDADGEYDKKIYLGEVPGQYSASIYEAQKIPGNKREKYGSSGWRNTMDVLNELSKQYGGYFRTRYIASGYITCLDWLDNSFRYDVNGQTIRLSENLIDISDQMEVENLFTALIPIGSSKGNNIYVEGYREDIHGHNKRILVPQIVGLFTDGELNVGYHSKTDYVNAVNQYGIIYRPQQFQNASTQEELWNEAVEWIKDNYFGGINTFNLTAVDMHHLNINVQKYLTGDRVMVMYPDMCIPSDSESERPLVNKILTLTSIQYNLHNPDKNTYTIGKPSMLVNKKYGSSSNSKKSTAQTSGSNHNQEDTNNEHSTDINELKQEAWNYVVNKKYNSDEYNELMARDPTGKTADLALHGSYIGLVEGFLAGDSRPTSGIHKKRLQNIMLDGVKASVELAGPVDRSLVTEEDVPVINSMNRTMIFDGLKQRFGLKTALDLTLPDFRSIPPKTRLEMKLNSGNNQTQITTYKPGNEPESLLPTIITSNVNGADGTISNVKNILGLDGSGNNGTLIQDGSNALLQFFNPSSVQAGSPSETAELDGNEGTGKIGKDSSGNWQVKLNEEVTYPDEDGVTRTAKGFVKAKDFSVQEIPSFKTKIGIFDIVIAGKVAAQEISADLAEIRKWLGERIVANTYIQTDHLYANSISSWQNIALNSGGNYHFQYQIANGTMRNVDDCLYDVQISESNGVITITLPRLNTSAAATASFNMASTQFYIDAVEAAYERGYEDGGGGGSSADDIRLAGWGHRATDPGSSYNNLSSLASEIQTVMASSRGGYVYFYAYINGDTSNKRYYKINLT